MSLTLPKPAALHGGALADELAAAGFPDAEVSDNGRGDIEVSGVSESDREAVQAVVDAHVPPAPPVDPSEDLAARLEALAAKTSPTVKEVIAALLGTDPSAAGAVAGRPTT